MKKMKHSTISSAKYTINIRDICQQESLAQNSCSTFSGKRTGTMLPTQSPISVHFPGWGNMLANGATTLYESWEYPDTVGSQNHPMFGSISEWFYKSLLGINARAPGFTKFEIKPQPAGDLTWAKGYYDAMVGRIVSDWHTEGVKFYLDVTIPANTKAFVYVPSLAKFPVTGKWQSG